MCNILFLVVYFSISVLFLAFLPFLYVCIYYFIYAVDGYKLIKGDITLSDFSLAKVGKEERKSDTEIRSLKKMEDYSEEDEDEKTRDCYLDLYACPSHLFFYK